MTHQQIHSRVSPSNSDGLQKKNKQKHWGWKCECETIEPALRSAARVAPGRICPVPDHEPSKNGDYWLTLYGRTSIERKPTPGLHPSRVGTGSLPGRVLGREEWIHDRGTTVSAVLLSEMQESLDGAFELCQAILEFLAIRILSDVGCVAC